MANKKSLSTLYGVLLFFVVFILVGGVYTFYNAKGFSYFSNDSKACNNCHVMNEVYADYMSGPHSKEVDGKPRATCAECHLPHSFIPKWIAKAQSGLGHAYAFTFKLDSLPTNLSATPKSKEIVQQNCIDCHSRIAENVVNATTIPEHSGKEALSCVSCHKDVGHKRDF